MLNHILSFTTFYYFSQRERLRLSPPSVVHPFGLPLGPGLNTIVFLLLFTGGTRVRLLAGMSSGRSLARPFLASLWAVPPFLSISILETESRILFTPQVNARYTATSIRGQSGPYHQNCRAVQRSRGRSLRAAGTPESCSNVTLGCRRWAGVVASPSRPWTQGPPGPAHCRLIDK